MLLSGKPCFSICHSLNHLQSTLYTYVVHALICHFAKSESQIKDELGSEVAIEFTRDSPFFRQQLLAFETRLLHVSICFTFTSIT